MPQLYKHNKGKWLLSTVVSKNTASNEEKWRSLRGRPVMCHWPTLSPKINHERGALWLRCGHPWSINLPPSLSLPFPSLPSPPSLPLCLPASLSLSLFLPNIHKCWHKLNQHKWRWIDDISRHICIDYCSFDFQGSPLWGVDWRKCTFLAF